MLLSASPPVIVGRSTAWNELGMQTSPLPHGSAGGG